MMFRTKMIQTEKIGIIRAMTPVGTETMDDSTIIAYLNSAGHAILNRLYPFDDVSEMEVPERYEFTQIRIAVYNIVKRGAEGETKHIEVGTERDYASADIPEDLMRELTPMCGIPE